MATCKYNEEPAAAESAMQCSACQHSVVVRGLGDIVCLAYLSVRHSVSADACAEFEVKRQRGAPSPSLIT